MTAHPSFVSSRLSQAEKFAYARQTVAGQLRYFPGLLTARFGDRATDRSLQLRAEPPDSRCAREAFKLAEDAYDAVLLNHCLRCWYFADLFAQLEHAHYDPELLYTSCLLHDIGLTETHHATGTAASCFAVHGGHVAAQMMRGWGASDQTAQLANQAIAAHMNPSVPAADGIEAHLLHAAANLDVAGTRAGQLPRSLIRETNTAYPRTDFTKTIVAAIRREAHENPDSRSAVLWKLGMALVIRLNPLENFTVLEST